MANNTGNTIIALATGITIGAGIGLLYAPQSGDKTRKQLKDEAAAIKRSGKTSDIEKVTAELERLERIGGIQSIIPTEGIVFVYKGKTMKLTGTFAAVNNLLGFIRYGR